MSVDIYVHKKVFLKCTFLGLVLCWYLLNSSKAHALHGLDNLKGKIIKQKYQGAKFCLKTPDFILLSSGLVEEKFKYHVKSEYY